jgi:hypothetical protein
MPAKTIIIFLVVLLIVIIPVVPQHGLAGSFEACREKLKRAQRLNVLTDLDWKPPREPKVVVGPTFFTMPFDAKDGFVQTVNCFLNAGGAKFVNFDLLDSINHKVVGRYEYGRLTMK